jgi:MOSC domain-containing protein
MRIGTVKQIWRFAVKSMAGEQLSSCVVSERGIPGDRGWAVRDETAGKLATGSRHPLLMQCAAHYREQPTNGTIHVDMRFPDGLVVGSDASDVDARLTELLEKPVSLSSLQEDTNAEHYFDVTPIHVLTTASLAEMSRVYPQGLWDVRRFRPNFFVETESSIKGLVEFDWIGKTLRIGEVEVQCDIPTERCAMAMNAQAEFPRDDGILRTIKETANLNLGIYARVIRPGAVHVNDDVELI